LTIPHPATQTFFALLQVRILLVVFLQFLKVTWQVCLQVMAASPVLVLTTTCLLGEAETTAPDDLATDDTATVPDVSGGDPEEVAD